MKDVDTSMDTRKKLVLFSFGNIVGIAVNPPIPGDGLWLKEGRVLKEQYRLSEFDIVK